MSVNITYFVHATTVENEKGLAPGHAPGELSELGIEQAKRLRELVAEKNFGAVFCSDLKRAVDSAYLAFGGKYEIILDKRLREADFGDFNLHPASEFKENLTDHIDKPFPNGESYKDVEKRIADFLDFLRANYQGKHIAIVAHQAPQLALDVLLKHRTWEQAIAEDWRNKKAWQPGWDYILED